MHIYKWRERHGSVGSGCMEWQFLSLSGLFLVPGLLI